MHLVGFTIEIGLVNSYIGTNILEELAASVPRVVQENDPEGGVFKFIGNNSIYIPGYMVSCL